MLDYITERLNLVIIALKKGFLQSNGGERSLPTTVSEAELRIARSAMTGLTGFLTDIPVKGPQTSYSILPAKLTESHAQLLLELLRADRSLKAIHRIIRTEEPLEREHLEIMDDMVSKLDRKRTEEFEKIRKARG